MHSSRWSNECLYTQWLFHVQLFSYSPQAWVLTPSVSARHNNTPDCCLWIIIVLCCTLRNHDCFQCNLERHKNQWRYFWRELKFCYFVLFYIHEYYWSNCDKPPYFWGGTRLNCQSSLCPTFKRGHYVLVIALWFLSFGPCCEASAVHMIKEPNLEVN